MLFKDQTVIATLAALSKFQNNARLIADKLTTFFYYHTTALIHRFERFNAIIVKSSNIVAPGDELTICGGVGSFTRASRPIMTVNGKTLAGNDNDMMVYKFKVPVIPGEYKVPVSID